MALVAFHIFKSIQREFRRLAHICKYLFISAVKCPIGQ